MDGRFCPRAHPPAALYSGIFSVPPNAAYFNNMASGAYGIFYTTDASGPGTLGDSSFTDIDPSVITNNLTFSIAREGSGASNYFAIQQGGAWYVSTNLLPGGSSYPNFLNVSTPYTNLASAWNTLTINAPGSGVTIGPPPSQNLSGLITGVGLVVNATGGGWDYSQVTISANVPVPTALPGALFSRLGRRLRRRRRRRRHHPGRGGLDRREHRLHRNLRRAGRQFRRHHRCHRFQSRHDESPDTANSVGIVYTTDASGNGGQGDSSFADIDPSLYPSGITFNLQSQQGDNPVFPPAYATNYLAVEVGGNWYVSVNPFTNNNLISGPVWTLNTFLYTNNNAAANWNTLAIGASTVTVGGAAGAPLTGPVQGIGIVMATGTFSTTTTGYGINQLNLSITALLDNTSATAPPVIDAPGFSQTAFATGTASFAVDAYIGSGSLGYTWTFAPAAGGAAVTIAEGANGSGTGSFIIGALSNLLTISNLSAADAGSYSVEVANMYGADYSTNYITNTLIVNPLTNNILYAETFPFVGPFPVDESLASVGWRSTIGPSLDERGSVYAYDTVAKTVAFYASTNTDVAGLSGTPFTAITPASYPFVSFRASVAAVSGAANASMYFAVQMAGGKWYVSSSPLQLGATPAAYTTYGLQFSPTASEWNSLTLGASSATIGSAATADLSGNIIGAGMVFAFTTNSVYSMNSFMLVTNSTPPVGPSFPSEPNVPYPQTVYVGAGVGFSFTEVGTVPFTNSWEFNDSPGTYLSGTVLADGTNADGSIFLGTTNTEVLLQNVQTGEQGIYSGWVVNGGGTNSTDSGALGSPTLTVVSQPEGLIYYEGFPVYSLPAGNLNLTNVGWTLQADTPTRLFKLNGGTADNQSGTSAAYAYESGYTNAVIYASTASDTGYSGLPFIAFDPANYPVNSIQFSTAMAQGDGAWTNVTVSFAIKQGGQWYASTPNPLVTASSTPAILLGTPGSMAANYVPFTQTYTNTAALWQMLTFTNSAGVLLGGTPAHNLSGSITAAGLLFQYFGAGGSVNFDSYTIQATGAGNLIGGANIAPGANGANGAITLTWIGNPNVSVQTTTSLTPPAWADVPNTLGQHSLTVTPGGMHSYYRLKGL